MNGLAEKYHAHQLIERLPDSQIATAVPVIHAAGSRQARLGCILHRIALARGIRAEVRLRIRCRVACFHYCPSLRYVATAEYLRRLEEEEQAASPTAQPAQAIPAVAP